jgi:cholesterol transport system auxiliary component
MGVSGSGGARARAALIVAGCLAACAVDPRPAGTAYDLAPAPVADRPLKRRVRVLPPVSSTDLDSDRMLVRTGPNALATMAGARWADRLPVLIQRRLAQAFPNAADAAEPDDNLETDVNAFELDAVGKQVAIEIVARVVSVRDGHIVATRTFASRAPVASTKASVVAAAMNAALTELMAQIIKFVAASA